MVSSEADLRTRAAKSQLLVKMSDSSSEEGPPTNIIDLEKTQVYPVDKITKSALKRLKQSNGYSYLLLLKSFLKKVYREVGLRYRNDTASRYEDSGVGKIGFSDESLNLMEALEVPAGIDETIALTGATPNRGLSRMSEHFACIQLREMTKGGLSAAYFYFS